MADRARTTIPGSPIGWACSSCWLATDLAKPIPAKRHAGSLGLGPTDALANQSIPAWGRTASLRNGNAAVDRAATAIVEILTAPCWMVCAGIRGAASTLVTDTGPARDSVSTVGGLAASRTGVTGGGHKTGVGWWRAGDGSAWLTLTRRTRLRTGAEVASAAAATVQIRSTAAVGNESTLDALGHTSRQRWAPTAFPRSAHPAARFSVRAVGSRQQLTYGVSPCARWFWAAGSGTSMTL